MYDVLGAAEAYNGKEIGGRQVRIDFAQAQGSGDRSGGSGRAFGGSFRGGSRGGSGRGGGFGGRRGGFGGRGGDSGGTGGTHGKDARWVWRNSKRHPLAADHDGGRDGGARW